MTGTAVTEAEEFDKIYKLDVVVMPTEPADDPRGRRRPRLPHPRRQVQRRRRRGRGHARDRTAGARRYGYDRELRVPRRTCSSAAASRTRCSTPSSTSKRRHIVAEAGRKGAVTIATNMAGRGTDIILGGTPDRPRPGRVAGGARRGRRRWAACTSSAPSATSRAASTTSCVAVPDARATRAARASTSASRTTSCAGSRRTGCRACWPSWAWKKTCRSSPAG